MYFSVSTCGVFLFHYIWYISISERMMYFSIRTCDVFLFHYIWYIAISQRKMYFSIRICDVFLFQYIWCISILVHMMYFYIWLGMEGNGHWVGGHWTSIEASGFSRQHCVHTITSLTEDIDILVSVEQFLLSVSWAIFRFSEKYFSFSIPFTQSLLCWQQDFIGSCQILL